MPQVFLFFAFASWRSQEPLKPRTLGTSESQTPVASGSPASKAMVSKSHSEPYRNFATALEFGCLRRFGPSPPRSRAVAALLTLLPATGEGAPNKSQKMSLSLIKDSIIAPGIEHGELRRTIMIMLATDS